ncbi:hypothetical protein ACFWCA_29230 [Streptomyces phaeochromogenes]
MTTATSASSVDGAKLVAVAFGMDPEATMIYLADHIDEGRLPAR